MKNPISDKKTKNLIETTKFRESKLTGLLIPDGVHEPDTFFKVRNNRRYSNSLECYVTIRHFVEFEKELTKSRQVHHLFSYALVATRQWVKQIETDKLEGDNIVGTNYFQLFKTYADMIDLPPSQFENGWPRVDKLWNKLFNLGEDSLYKIPPEVRRANKLILSTGEKSSGQAN
jgi:hypothetical protein